MAAVCKWVIGAGLLCHGQTALPPDLAALAKIKGKVAQNLKQLPNFTCTETIERWWQRQSDHRPQPLDTVQVEVAYVDGKELFGRPKVGRIDQPEIQRLVQGSISKGSFATIAATTIQGSSTMFHYEGAGELNGHPAELFSFRVGILGSGYQITTASGRAQSGYRGRFWTDPSTFDLMRFEMAADDIPPVLDLASASESIDYRRVVVGNSRFLLPHVSELRMKDIRGYQVRNLTTYQDCRQFVAGSTLSFEGADSSMPAPGSPADESKLPVDFTVRIGWDTAIDATNQAGDSVSATLLENVLMNQSTAVPKGAKLSGHIQSIDKQAAGFAVKMKFTSLDFKGVHLDLEQRLCEVSPIGNATLAPGGQFLLRSRR